MLEKPQIEAGSFRDPSGFMFYWEGLPYRAINKVYGGVYDLFMNSGLYQKLSDDKLIVRHEVIDETQALSFRKNPLLSDVYKIIKPDKVSFISYPFEWTFSQLKAAALLTLKIQELALKSDMTLKDASAYNVQFNGTESVFIDTLSFEPYAVGEPWGAYRQFCQHFLVPLLLMKYKSTELQRLSYLYMDGIPLSLASKLLPRSTRLNPLIAIHIHYHSKIEDRYSDKPKSKVSNNLKLSKNKLLGIIQHLKSGIESLDLKITKSQWGDYYEEFSYTDSAIEVKKETVEKWVEKVGPGSIWDVGCNTGLFSEIAAKKGNITVAFDSDYWAIEKLYRNQKKKNDVKILPLLMDFTNPTSSIGWAHEERKSLIERGPADLVLALALIHHIAISNNVPFVKIAKYFSRITNWLIIEFVPKDDPQSQRLLVTRKDVFEDYNLESFEESFRNYFNISERIKIPGSGREMFLMNRKN